MDILFRFALFWHVLSYGPFVVCFEFHFCVFVERVMFLVTWEFFCLFFVVHLFVFE